MPLDKPDDDKTRSLLVLAEGTMVSHYRIVEKIGAGGMGEVYLAEDTKLNRQVALKFLPSHLVSNEDIRTRFVREAQTIAKLSHPNIVSVHEVSEFSGRPFYVMELVSGESLSQYTKSKPLPFDTLVDYAIQICQGLGEAHRSGIVHRDIKPANIAVDEQRRVRLLDFGLAAVEGDYRLTKTGSTLGTVAYMSPEQVSGREIDNRSDLFSLGIVLYELIAGQTPFRKDNEGATLKAIMEDNPQPLTRYRSDVPEKLEQIVSELLEKDKELRCQSAESVVAALKRLVYDSQQTEHTRITQVKPRKKGLFIAVAAVAVLCVAGISYFWMKSEQVVIEAPMIAVLPFDNLGSPDDQYFADGMTDEITSRLAMIKGLGVISRTSSKKYESTVKSLKEIGAELGVEFILEGTVRWSKTGDQPRVKITPQLIRVADDRHLWANNYERELMEVFAVQADIAEKIVEQLDITLVETDKEMLADIPTDHLQAYQLYLRALNLLKNNGDANVIEEILDSVTAFDSSFALAYAAKSEAISWWSYRMSNSDRGRRALKAARKSLELEPGLPQGHFAMGYYYEHVESDNERALEHYSLAKSELHNNPKLLQAIAKAKRQQGRFEEALVDQNKATILDPLSPHRHYLLAELFTDLKRYDEAEESIDRAIAMRPKASSFYSQKITNLIHWHGNIEIVKPVINDALTNCDTIQFISRNWWLTRYLPELEWHPIMVDYVHRKFADTTDYSPPNPIDIFNWTEDLTIFKDRIDEIQEEVEQANEFYNNTGSNLNLGILLSLLGECDKGIEYGLIAKEMLPIEESPLLGRYTIMGMAQIYGNCGDYEKAIDEIEIVLSLKNTYTMNWFKFVHWVDPFRDHPRFQALVEKYDTK